MMTDFVKDFLVFGAGVAGMWLFNDLSARGYDVALIESNTLGGVQTLGSQGMIHGGQKYTLTGHVDDVAKNVAQMPGLWQECLTGKGLIDLSCVEVLAPAQVMWPDNKLMAGAASFAAAKSVNAETETLSSEALPDVLKLHNIKTGYLLSEVVMDTKSLTHALTDKTRDHIHKARLADIVMNDRGIDHVLLEEGGRVISVNAKKYLFACGKGNEGIVDKFGAMEQVTQRRPLRQVMVKSLPYPLFGHCVTTSPKPRVTVTSYDDGQGGYIWYLGGGVAEKGVDMDEDEHIAFADKEMRDLFPQLDWDTVLWSSWDVDRAEAYDPQGHLPPGPQIKEYGDAIVVWPSKMTFAPALSVYMARWLDQWALAPAEKRGESLPFKAPPVGLYPWEHTEWQDGVQIRAA